MKASFIQSFLIGVAEAIIFMTLGCLITLLMQSQLSIVIKLLAIAGALVLMIVGEWCASLVIDKLNTSSNRQNMHQNIPANRNNMQQANQLTTNTNNNPGKVNPLDEAPLSARKRENPALKKVGSIALIGEQGNVLLEWNLQNKTAVIIGKNSDKETVDIDLSGSAMAQMISKQHAVLNYTDNGWYVDDIDSKNGTRVKKKNQSAFLDVKLVGAVEVEAGDIIYIANAMLQVR